MRFNGYLSEDQDPGYEVVDILIIQMFILFDSNLFALNNVMLHAAKSKLHQ
jgi:hypothetical protein